MAQKTVDRVVGTIREGFEEAGERVEAVAEKVETALEDAVAEGRHLKKKVRAELVRRWRTANQLGRENAFVMALGALGVGILIGYLISRDRD